MRSFINSILHQIYYSDQIKEDEWAGYVARMGEMRNEYNIFVRRPEKKRPLGRPRHRWEDDTVMELGEIGWVGVDWIHLAQDTDQWWDFLSTTP
jgi:hypothetical protein